jgi:hypothetical protein
MAEIPIAKPTEAPRTRMRIKNGSAPSMR